MSLAEQLKLEDEINSFELKKMDDAILERYKASEISAETAYLFAQQKQRFEHLRDKKED